MAEVAADTRRQREREGGEMVELKPGPRTACYTHWSVKTITNMGHLLVH